MKKLISTFLMIFSFNGFAAEHADVVSTYSCKIGESSDRMKLVKIITAIQYTKVNNVLNKYRHHNVTEVTVAEGLDTQTCIENALEMEQTAKR